VDDIHNLIFAEFGFPAVLKAKSQQALPLVVAQPIGQRLARDFVDSLPVSLGFASSWVNSSTGMSIRSVAIIAHIHYRAPYDEY
jgi:hypothetical protein